MKKVFINKKKIIFFLFIILIFNLGLVVSKEDNNYVVKNEYFQIYTITSGDTLWKIVDDFQYNNKSEFIFEIERINKIKSEDLKPGYKIAIPIYENE